MVNFRGLKIAKFICNKPCFNRPLYSELSPVNFASIFHGGPNMKRMLVLVSLLLLAFQVYSLNADESKKPDGVIVTTTLESGPDLNALQLKKVR